MYENRSYNPTHGRPVRETQETQRKGPCGLPRVPGVYLMKDDKGVVVYVGKAAKPARPGCPVTLFLRRGTWGSRKQPMIELY